MRLPRQTSRDSEHERLITRVRSLELIPSMMVSHQRMWGKGVARSVRTY
jgi:hypothetical protein